MNACLPGCSVRSDPQVLPLLSSCKGLPSFVLLQVRLLGPPAAASVAVQADKLQLLLSCSHSINMPLSYFLPFAVLGTTSWTA